MESSAAVRPSAAAARRAVLGDRGRIVARAAPDVEAGVEALRDAALAGEEGVAHARQFGEQRRDDGRDLAHAAASNAGGAGAGPDRGGLEELAHLVGRDQPFQLAGDRLGAVRPRPLQRRRARLDPEPAQELALGQQGGARAGRARRGQNGREVGVHGQVRLAGRSQRADLLVSLERLQRIAEPRRVAAVVDRAAPRRPGATRRSASSAANASCAGERSITVADWRVVGRVRQRCGPQAEGQLAVLVQADHPLGPAPLGALELAGWQAVEQLVGDQQQRRVGRQLGERGRPARRRRPPAARPATPAAARTARPARARRPRRTPARGARRAARRPSASRRPARPRPARSAAARPARARSRTSQSPISSPNICETSGAVMKSPPLAQRRPRRVVAVLGIVQAARHERGDVDRPAAAISAFSRAFRLMPEARLARRAPAALAQRPPDQRSAARTIIGIESIIPMVRPSGKFGMPTSGLRTFSSAMRIRP